MPFSLAEHKVMMVERFHQSNNCKFNCPVHGQTVLYSNVYNAYTSMDMCTIKTIHTTHMKSVMNKHILMIYGRFMHSLLLLQSTSRVRSATAETTVS